MRARHGVLGLIARVLEHGVLVFYADVAVILGDVHSTSAVCTPSVDADRHLLRSVCVSVEITVAGVHTASCVSTELGQ